MATENYDLNEIKRRMQGAIQSLKHELSGLRTGRASPALLEHVQVDAYGSHMPLNQLATISVPDPRLLNVQVWDRSMIHPIEKAISAANLGLTPSTEGQVIRLRIPELNEERRKEIAKVAHKYAEHARVAVRNVRRDGIETLRKQHPEIPAFLDLSEETRLVVSEPLTDLAGAWNVVPASHYGVIEPGDDELKKFVPRED